MWRRDLQFPFLVGGETYKMVANATNTIRPLGTTGTLIVEARCAYGLRVELLRTITVTNVGI
jgi:hypothetical protein